MPPTLRRTLLRAAVIAACLPMLTGTNGECAPM